MKKKKYLQLKFNRVIRTFPFSSITEMEDFSELDLEKGEDRRLVLVLNNGNRYECRKSLERIREMVLESWRQEGEIVDPDFSLSNEEGRRDEFSN
jgi:hypothetical protein